MTPGSRSDFQPIAGDKFNFFTVNFYIPASRKNPLDLLIAFVKVNKWHICSSGKAVYTDFSTS